MRKIPVCQIGRNTRAQIYPDAIAVTRFNHRISITEFDLAGFAAVRIRKRQSRIVHIGCPHGLIKVDYQRARTQTRIVYGRFYYGGGVVVMVRDCSVCSRAEQPHAVAKRALVCPEYYTACRACGKRSRALGLLRREYHHYEQPVSAFRVYGGACQTHSRAGITAGSKQPQRSSVCLRYVYGLIKHDAHLAHVRMRVEHARDDRRRLNVADHVQRMIRGRHPHTGYVRKRRVANPELQSAFNARRLAVLLRREFHMHHVAVTCSCNLGVSKRHDGSPAGVLLDADLPQLRL